MSLKSLKIQNSWTKTFVFILVLVFYASLATHKIILPVYDDLPRQIKIGEEIMHGNFDILYKNTFSYTEPEYTFYNHHWLSGVVFYLLHSVLGWSGMVVFKVLVLILAFAILFFTALKKANFWLVAITSVPAILILSERTGLRPEIFSYLFIAIFLWFLFDLENNPKSKKIFWLIPIQLLWVNMHVFFSVGIMLVGGFLFEKIIFDYKSILNNFKEALYNNEILKKLSIIFVGIILVSFINPRCWEGVFYRYTPNFPAIIIEFQNLSQFGKTLTSWWGNISVATFKISFFLLILSFAVYLWSNRKSLRLERLPIFFILASLATIILTFNVLRAISFFAIIFLIVFPINLNSYFGGLKERLSRKYPKIKGIAIFIFIILLFILILPKYKNIISPNTEWGLGLTKWSNSSIDFFRNNNLHGPIFNDADVGSYLIYYLYPQEKVFVDNRFGDAYSAEFFDQTLFASLENETVWLQVSKKYDFQTIFLYHYGGNSDIRSFIWRRLHDPAWILVHVDMYNVIFIRNLKENQEIIDKYGINAENVEKRIKNLTDSDNYYDLIVAADLFNIIGREDLGSQMFLKVVYRWPQKGRIWMVMGELELAMNQYRNYLLSMMYLERAISLGHKSAEAYYYLGLTYYKLGQQDKAIEALKKALKINPDRRDAKNLLYQIAGRTNSD